VNLRGFVPLGLWMFIACAHGGGASLGPREPLTLRQGAGLRLDGAVGDRPAEVVLAVEEPRSRITAECFARSPVARGRVRLPVLEGGWETFPELEVSRASLEGRPAPTFTAAVVPGNGTCQLWLGSDVLGRSVLDVDFQARTVALRDSPPTLPKEAEWVVVDLTRAPETDRLLVFAQLNGAAATVMQTLVLGTGRSTELALLTSRALGAEGLIRAVQLAPDWEACDVPVQANASWRGAPAVGLLGPEAWGAQRAVLDLGPARLTLVRPKGLPAPPCRAGEVPESPEQSRELEPR
jgi:hypothetical protein